MSVIFLIGSDCQTKKVGIELKSEEWKSAYSNQASVEYKNLESKVLSAVSYPKVNVHKRCRLASVYLCFTADQS